MKKIRRCVKVIKKEKTICDNLDNEVIEKVCKVAK